MNRMQYPEFIELLQKYDFICLTESKTDDFDTLNIPGYNFVLKYRKINSEFKSGGIVFGSKEGMEKYIFIILKLKVIWYYG